LRLRLWLWIVSCSHNSLVASSSLALVTPASLDALSFLADRAIVSGRNLRPDSYLSSPLAPLPRFALLARLWPSLSSSVLLACACWLSFLSDTFVSLSLLLLWLLSLIWLTAWLLSLSGAMTSGTGCVLGYPSASFVLGPRPLFSLFPRFSLDLAVLLW
jgi:hypothetical protein